LRPDAREATFLRSKLVCDMHNRLGLPSISANYAQLYVNDEYMGFYILLDSIKLSWVEFEYGDKDSTTLYQCKNMNNNLTVKTSSTGCVNENEDVTDNSEWVELLTALDAAQSAEDIEDIFDVDQFLTEIAYEYLAGSWDHYLNFGHNFYMYKPKDDKWKFLLYDFDGEIGQDVSMGAGGFGFGQQQSTKKNTDYPSYSFEEWTKQRHLIDILILNNSTRFDNIVKKFVTDVFNPATLFPHIDELKEFIRPYVELDKTPDENGKYPGKLNESANDYSLAQWDANCEYTMIRSAQNSKAYGLKHWILSKYRYICKTYDMECDEKYLDENYEYSIDEELDISGEEETFGPPGGQGGQGGFPGGPGGQGDAPNTPPKDKDTTSQKYKCWVEQYGYPCCNEENSKLVYDTDEEGDWGYDFEKGEWCGITPYTEYTDDEECWSEEYGYKCCKNCYVYETDDLGKWGYDFDKEEWCGIQSYCKSK
ncbi:putative cellulase, partial [Anaeromyces robustus]